MLNEIIKLWKEKKIDHAIYEFSCGGDSMNDTTWYLYDKNGQKVTCDEITNYLEDDVYKEVEFYVNSDGHYQGEFGEVRVELNEDDEDFDYSKSSRSEWNETHTEVIEVELTETQAKYISENVSNLGGDGDGEFNFDYKRDFILNEECEKIEEELEKLILDEVREHEPDIDEGDLQDWVTFRAVDEGEIETLKLVDNKLSLVVSNSVTIIKED
jgi:hypothetical protein